MRKIFFLGFTLLLLCLGCPPTRPALFTLGIFQVNEAPTLNAVREGFIKAIEDEGLVDGRDVRLIVKNGRGSIAEVQRIAEEFVAQNVDIIVALSTPSLQAALHATRRIPIVFSSVANPYLAGAGNSAVDHLSNVTGVTSRGPIRQSLTFIKDILPGAKRIGTLWTPSELNSQYYLNLAEEAAADMGLEIVAVPIANTREILLAAQLLVNKRIDVIYQISDNTINASFRAVAQVADENAIPLFGGFLLSTRLGACAALGWDFTQMGYMAGRIALRVKDGEDPAQIPIQEMKEVKLYLNTDAAARQKIDFPGHVLSAADEIYTGKEETGSGR